MNNRSWSRRRFVSLGLAALPLSAAGAAASPYTPRQTEGPFYPRQKPSDADADLTRIEGREGRAQGQLIQVSGQVLDRDQQPIAGALVDVWQANRYGRYAHPADSSTAPLDAAFQGYAQLRCDERGFYRFTSIMPGPYPVSARWSRPPHIHFKVSKQGFSMLTTQMYFAGQPLNERDALLQQVPESERDRLVVTFHELGRSDSVEPIRAGRFNIILRSSS